MNKDIIFFCFEIIGTVAFAITGALTAVEKKLDILGAVVLGAVTAVGGGVMRDMILGYLPPVTFRKPVYALTAIAVSVLVFIAEYFFGEKMESHKKVYDGVLNIFDSIGLAVFTVAGVNSAAACGFSENMFLSVFVAVLTGVGGGVLRDLMAGKIPSILRKRVYALAAIIGAVIYCLVIEFTSLPMGICMAIGSVSVLIIRICATVFHWNLPRIKS